MRLQFGSIITDARGKLGGHSFAKNKNGNFARRNQRQKRTRTNLQANHRARFARISDVWNNLSQQQRNAWHQFGQNYTKTDNLGKQYQLNGREIFFQRQLNRLEIGLPIKYNTPNYTPQVTIDANILVLDIDNKILNIRVESSVPDFAAVFYLAPFITPG